MIVLVPGYERARPAVLYQLVDWLSCGINAHVGEVG
jgi:hypothetical protein